MRTESDKLSDAIEKFRSGLNEPKIEKYARRTTTSLGKYLSEVWREIEQKLEFRSLSDVTKKVIVYWTSVYHEKGILRAAYFPPERKIEAVASSRAEFELMQKLMVLDRKAPRHLLLWLITNNKECAELVRHDQASYIIPSERTLQLKLETHLTSAQKRLLNRLLKKIKDGKKLPDSFPALQNLVNFNDINVLIHPLYQMGRFDYTRILYFPINMGEIMFAGVVLGLTCDNEFQISGEQVNGFKKIILDRFIYPIHSAEARATAIASPAPSVLYLPRDAFVRECTFTVNNIKKAEGCKELIHNLSGKVEDSMVKDFLESLCSLFDKFHLEDKPLSFWDYTEEIFWALFDATDPELRKSKKSVDLMRSRAKILTDVRCGPMALLSRALANELPLQELAGYRDHFAHSFHLFLIGLFLLEYNAKPFSLNGGVDKDIVERAWFLAAFFHDIGYGIEKLESLSNDYLKKMIGENAESHHSDFPIEIPMDSHWGTALIPARFIKALDGVISSFSAAMGVDQIIELRSILHKALMGESPDHGVLSAMLLEYSLSDLIKWRGKNREALKRALSAIALHNAPTWVENDLAKESCGKRVSHAKKRLLKEIFSTDWSLLSRLLTCCDELACMGRQKSERYHPVKLISMNFSGRSLQNLFSKIPWRDEDKLKTREDTISEILNIKVSITGHRH